MGEVMEVFLSVIEVFLVFFSLREGWTLQVDVAGAGSSTDLVRRSSCFWLGWAVDCSVRLSIPGMLIKLALRVPGSAGCAGCEPSMLTSPLALEEFCLARSLLPRFLRVEDMDPQSVGRFARAWKQALFRMMVYTRLELPSNWYWIRLLNISSRKNTRWWLEGDDRRNQGVENASRRWRSLQAAIMDMDLM